MLRPRYLFHGTFAFVCVTFISCGEDSSFFSSKTNPCSLITSAEAERALGEPVQEGTRLDRTTCVFKASQDSANAVTVQIDETPGKDHRAWFNKERLRRDSILIPGLGDGAVRIDSPPSLARLTFLRGENLVTIMVSSLRNKHVSESVMVIGMRAAERYGAPVVTAQASLPSESTTSKPTTRDFQAPAPLNMPTSPAAFSQSRAVGTTSKTGPTKATPIDAVDLVGTWQARTMQSTTRHDFLLVIQPNRTWSLSSLMQFDGVMDAEAGRWTLDRANTFNGQSWKGTYQITTPTVFSSTGSLHGTWIKLAPDQSPSRIPLELWDLRRESTSIPVFQLKSVDQALVGLWEGTGTYAGGPALLVWSIKPSAATDLFIMDTTRGTVTTKGGLVLLQPAQKQQRSLGIVAIQDGGFTTSDGKVSIRWTRVPSQPSLSPQL